MAGQFHQDLLHGPVQIHPHTVLVLAPVLVGNETAGVVIKLLDPDAIPVDLRLDITIS